MFLSVGEFSADADDEHGAVLAADGILALMGCEVGIALEEFLAVDEVDLARQEGLYLRVALAHQIFGAEHGRVDTAHHIAQEGHGALAARDDRLPVPLVHIERVDVVQFLVGAYGVHVGIDAVARLYAILRQGEPLPFGQRVYHLGLYVAEVEYGEGDGALHAVEVVVHTQALQHEEGCCDALQPQFGAQVLLEEVFNQFDALLRLTLIEQSLVSCRFNQFTHTLKFSFLLPCFKFFGKGTYNLSKQHDF